MIMGREEKIKNLEMQKESKRAEISKINREIKRLRNKKVEKFFDECKGKILKNFEGYYIPYKLENNSIHVFEICGEYGEKLYINGANNLSKTTLSMKILKATEEITNTDEIPPLIKELVSFINLKMPNEIVNKINLSVFGGEENEI